MSNTRATLTHPEYAQQLSVVGQSVPKVDAFAKVPVAAKFTVDLHLPGMLFGRILRTPHPHARIQEIAAILAAAAELREGSSPILVKSPRQR